MAAASQGAPPLRPTPTARLSHGSSDYLLLTTETTPLVSSSAHGSLPALPPPRPRFVPVLQLAALLDVCSTLALALAVPLSALPKSALAANLARGTVVGAVVSSSWVRRAAPIMLGQAVLSALILLFRLNELVQTSSTSTRPAELLNPTTTWYLSSFAWACAHYALFAAIVGIRRPREGAREWGEQRWEGAVERVGVPRARSVSVRSASMHEEAFDGEEEEEDAGTNSDGGYSIHDDDDDDDDADDIIDIPLPHSPARLRNRTSRASLLGVLAGPPPAEGDRPGLRASRGYGSIRSLAGI